MHAQFASEICLPIPLGAGVQDQTGQWSHIILGSMHMKIEGKKCPREKGPAHKQW